MPNTPAPNAPRSNERWSNEPGSNEPGSNDPMTSAPMSSEPMPAEPGPSEPTSRRPSSGKPAAEARHLTPARDYFGADAELVLTALSRMVAVVRGERTTLDRLLTALGEMAGAIAQAKAAMQPGAGGPEGADLDIAALLDEFEHRVDAMLEIVSSEAPAVRGPTRPMPDAVQPPPARDSSAPRIEPVQGDRVPTVSGVVSRLGRDEDTNVAGENTGNAPGADHAGVPTVSMLEAMVEALNASVPAAAPDTASLPPVSEAEPPAAEASIEVSVETLEVSVEAAAPIPLPDRAIVPESEPPVGFADLAAMPSPPPEAEEAVFFTAAAGSEADAGMAEPTEQQQAQSHDEEPTVEPPHNEEPAAERLPLPMLDLPEVLPARFLAPAPADETEPEPAAPPVESVLPAPPAIDPGFDWATDLAQEFAKPAASEPPPTEMPKPATAQPPAMRSQAVEPSKPAPPPDAKPNASDPLAPLKAMSPAEKIALFS